MIEVNTERFANIECLHACPAGQRHEPLPTVLFYHGYTSSKEVYSYFAVALAQAGFRAILPDADMHGSRYDGDSERRLTHFWEILRSNIDEVAGIVQALREQTLIEGARLAVAGASMGGMTALGALARYPQLRSAACMMGSGYFSQLAHTLFPPLVARTPDQRKVLAERLAPLDEYEVSHQLAKIANRPLLVWHGEADDVVPVAESVRLEKALRESGQDSNLTYLTEKGIGHRITPPALTAMTAFFKHHL
ncbi:esterase [Erwinia sorbitola]|uniref:Esterase n=1 Tax=Erwinia sorbitola TaxID=2681984 RepID=A0A6I6ESB6_9GAMM|nr:esterase [Erwinia sorbitola]MTD27590.1 esterase [Erwinia sorbitola]QGU89126.1 esterase [Erwinia sorbitola]